MPRRSSTLLSAKMLRASSSTSKHRFARPDPRRSGAAARASAAFRPADRRRPGAGTARSHRAGAPATSTPLTTTLRAMVCSCASSSADSSRPVKTTTGMSASSASPRICFQHFEAGHVRQPQIEHHAIGRLCLAESARPRSPVPTVAMSISSWPSNSVMLTLLGRIVLDDQQALAPRLRRNVLILVKRGFEALGRGRLGDERECAARKPVLPILVQRHDLHGNVPRVRVLLQLAQHGPAQHVGQEHVERYRGRLDTRGPEPARRRRASATSDLKALVAAPGRRGCAHNADRLRRSAASSSPGSMFAGRPESARRPLDSRGGEAMTSADRVAARLGERRTGRARRRSCGR